MAACPEEQSSSPKEPLKICPENTVNHERRKNCYNELSNFSKNHENFSEISEKPNPDVNTLSEDEFLQLMIEASTFNKSSKQESALLQKLRIDNPITETEPSDKVKLRTNSQFPPVPKNNNSRTYNNSLHARTSDGRKKHSRNKDTPPHALQKGIHQSQSLQDLMSSDLSKSRQRSHKAQQRTHSLSSDALDADSLQLLKKLGRKAKGAPPSSNGAAAENGLVNNHCGPAAVSGSRAGSPLEIEMDEIRTAPEEEGNSKFYVDCNDIDSTVSFPLKMVSSLDEQNNEIVGGGGDPLKRFPIVPWPRPLQVQSFFTSLPTDTFSGNDKQLLNADINGNPFTRNTRPSNLASFVSSTLMDYSGAPEAKNRKNKRQRNSDKQGVLAENIAGHRGEEDIDSLLQFINSSDKKAKKKAALNGGGAKDGVKKGMGSIKKDLKRSSSLENISRTDDVFLFESRGSASALPDHLTNVLPSGGDEETPSPPSKVLDINSNEEELKWQRGESSTSESSLEVSSFAADFYSTADVSSQTIEESGGFSVVKKKQRKKHPGKRSESHRWRNAQAQRKKGMMLPLAESKCGKQDARRKSTSSVPHSEHSSADNSDLDSVHSLPVRGSVPHPTQSHPHTTPSSSSSTPQASYADIARMPISNKPSIQETKSSSVPAAPKRKVPAPEMAREVVPPKEEASVALLREEMPAILPREPVQTVENDSESSDVKLRSCPKSTREINTQTEPEMAEDARNQGGEEAAPRSECDACSSLVAKAACSCSKVAAKSVIVVTEESRRGEDKTDCGSCSLRKSACACPRSPPRSGSDLPPVIMDNMPPETNACNVSFGFGIEEVLQMDNLTQPELPTVNSQTDSSSRSPECPPRVQRPDLSREQSSHLQKVCYGSNRNLRYHETNVNVKRFNHSELTRFLGNEFYSIEREIRGVSRRGRSKPPEYYVDSSEEA